MPTAPGLVTVGLAAVPFVRTLLVELANGLLAAAEIVADGVLECVAVAGLLPGGEEVSLVPVVELDDAEAGLTPSTGSRAAVAPARDALDTEDAAPGRVTRPTVVLPMRPAAVAVLVVALDGAVRLVAPGAMEGLDRPEAVVDDEALDLAAEAAEEEAKRLPAASPVDRAEAVVACALAERAADGARDARTAGLLTDAVDGLLGDAILEAEGALPVVVVVPRGRRAVVPARGVRAVVAGPPGFWTGPEPGFVGGRGFLNGEEDADVALLSLLSFSSAICSGVSSAPPCPGSWSTVLVALSS